MMMKNPKQITLDEFDKRLLRAVQRDGSLTHAQLAEVVHLSPSQCARRLERLRKDGYLAQTVTLLDRERLGLHVLAHVMVSVRSHDHSANEAFYAFVRDAPEVLECFAQTGDIDLLLRVAVGGLEELADFIDRLIESTGGVAALKSCIVLRAIKTTNQLMVR